MKSWSYSVHVNGSQQREAQQILFLAWYDFVRGIKAPMNMKEGNRQRVVCIQKLAAFKVAFICGREDQRGPYRHSFR